MAVCYESLALAAHKYSKHKLTLFKSGHQSFEDALEFLPEEQDTGHFDAISQALPTGQDAKSTCSDFDASVSTPVDKPLTPCPQIFVDRDEPDETPEISNVTDLETTPDFNKYSWSPRQIFADGDNSIGTPRSDHDHKFRLSQSLSDNHMLEEALVPPPLFKSSDSMSASAVTAQTETGRPLPQLPFNHNVAAFTHQGSRLVHRPQPNSYAPPTPSRRRLLSDIRTPSPSPFTPRYNLIRNTFEPRPNPCTISPLEIPLTATTSSHQSTHTHSSKQASQTFSTTITNLRHRIQTHHLLSITQQLCITHLAQEDHQRRKVKQGTGRVASFWLLKPISPTSRAVTGPVGPARKGRRRAAGLTNNERGRWREDGDQSSSETDCVEMRERIERLRENGWRVGRMVVGFKGTDYYEELERAVLRELEGALMALRR